MEEKGIKYPFSIDGNYLDFLPEEIKIIVLSKLPLGDQLRLEEAFPQFASLIFRTHVIESQHFEDGSPLVDRHLKLIRRCAALTSLNLNNVFWIASFILRDAISKLENLKSLYILNTKIFNEFKESPFLCLNNLETLAFSCRKINLRLKHFPRGIRNLCIHFDNSASFSLQSICTALATGYPNLKELWIFDLTPFACGKQIILDSFSIKQLVLGIPGNYLTVTTNFRRNFKDSVAGITCFECSSEPDIYSNCDFFDKKWSSFIHLTTKYPFCWKDVEKFNNKLYSPCEVQYEEIDLSHKTLSEPCKTELLKTINNILLCENMRNLKKFRTNYCIFKDFENGSLFQKLVLNSPKLEELEVWNCSCLHRYGFIRDEELLDIQSLVHLKKLTLHEIPGTLCGSFFETIFKTCKQLSSLRLKIKHPSFILKHNIYKALSFALALEELRLESPDIAIDKLCESLSKIQRPQIQNVLLRCSEITCRSISHVHDFFRKNRVLLIFFGIVIYGETTTKRSMDEWCRTFRSYQKYYSQVFTVVHQDNYSIFSPYHYRLEMIEFRSRVCKIDIFNDFIR